MMPRHPRASRREREIPGAASHEVAEKRPLETVNRLRLRVNEARRAESTRRGRLIGLVFVVHGRGFERGPELQDVHRRVLLEHLPGMHTSGQTSETLRSFAIARGS